MSRNVLSAACKCHNPKVGHKGTLIQSLMGWCNSNSTDWLCPYSSVYLSLAKPAVFAEYAPLSSHKHLRSIMHNDNDNIVCKQFVARYAIIHYSKACHIAN